MNQVSVEPFLDKMGVEYEAKEKYLNINGNDLGKPLKPNILKFY